jgi:alpha/beta superfamily hydrolase
MTETALTFPSGPLRLEGVAAIPAGATRAVVLCHPHPEYGGTMDDAVVGAVGHHLGAAGVAEVDDVRAALDCLAAQAPAARLALVGYSFGAAVALRAGAVDPRPERVVAIALPAVMLEAGFLSGCRTPTLFVHGDRDQFCPTARLDALLAECAAETEVTRLAGADHFLRGAETRVGDAVVRFVTRA